MPAKVSYVQSCVKKLTGLISLGLMLTGTAHAAEPYKAVVVLFGDSITTGFNSNFQDSRIGGGSTTHGCPTIYLNNNLRQEPARTAQQACPTATLDSPVLDQNKKIRNAIVANWGLGGSNTTDGKNRISSNLSQTKSAFNAENYFVLIMYGTNDRSFGISSTITKFNTQEMISDAIDLGYEPIVGTLPPRDDMNISSYNSQIVSAANSKGVFVVDHFTRFINQPGGWRTLLEQDTNPSTGQLVRLHPNDQGYLVIAETWFDQRLEDRIPGFNKFSIAPIMTILFDN